MSSISAAIGQGVGQLVERLWRPADALPQNFPPLSNANSRAAATATLAAMAMGALLILALPLPLPRSGAATKPADGVADIGIPAGPVRIVGATPRSDDCREQVWPYIEQRCLARADRKPALAAADEPAPARATSAAAPAESGPPAGAARPRVATAYLAMPRLRFAPDAGRFGVRVITPDRDTVWQDIEVGSDGAEGLVLGEPRRRSGRRAHRYRGRSFFPFRF